MSVEIMDMRDNKNKTEAAQTDFWEWWDCRDWLRGSNGLRNCWTYAKERYECERDNKKKFKI